MSTLHSTNGLQPTPLINPVDVLTEQTEATL